MSETMPTPLQHGSAVALEFERLREMLSGCCQSDLGRARVAALAPTDDATWIEHQQQLTEEVRAYIRAGGGFDFHGLTDVRQMAMKARIQGAALEMEELRDVLLMVARAEEWREAVMHPPQALREGWPTVEAMSAEVADFAALLGWFANKLAPDGTLDDNASPVLASVRREIERQRRQIQNSLRGYLRRLSEGDALQEELVTIRGDRFVIPVKTEQKRRVQGVVHGASSSGQTVFVEPLETIEQNNELVRLLEDEQREIHRILLEMTRRLGEHSQEILAAEEVLREAELQFAKARLAEQYGCARVKLLTEDAANSLVLVEARHPVMERNLRARGRKVVPLTLEMERGARQLIISGPNTGGKTVGLKTVGLLALMAQAGMPVPAERAEMPVFDAVLADIGDSQSIEQNLSTFSAHVTNIDFISHTATGRSLVLLDELGSATDPEEGAALAVAIAEHFLKAGALTIISTHHTALKMYAANRAGVLNAAVGFDEATLGPTYELKVGVPGASAGINIAQQIGLNAEIISAARERLSTQTQDIAGFLAQLHRDLNAAEHERLELKRREQEVARERSRLAAEGMKEQREKVRELEKKLESLLRDFEYQAREAVNGVQDRAAQQKLSKEAERRIAKARREFREQFNHGVVAHTTGADRGDANAQPHVVQRVNEGDTVQLKSLGRSGKVVRKFEDNTLEVQVGPMKMRVPVDDVATVIVDASRNPVQAARSRGVNVRLTNEDAAVVTELNVIGHTVDEATDALEKFLDRAFLAGAEHVRVVHGSGMGILRRALREYLKRHPQVAGISEPPQNMGGGGATEVQLKV